MPVNPILTVSGDRVGAGRVEDGFNVPKHMMIYGSAHPASPDCSGELFFIQDVRPFIEYTYKDGSKSILQSDDYLLDTANPASSMIVPAISTGFISLTKWDTLS